MTTSDRAILLVEDNPSDVTLTRRAFRQHNVLNPLVVVEDGVEALDYMFGTGAHAGRDPADTPKVILLDLKLPKVDGLEVLRRIRAEPRFRRVPVVILTTSDEHDDLAQAYDLGANSYVRKPVDFGEFVESVRNLGVYWLLLNQPPPPVDAPESTATADGP